MIRILIASSDTGGGHRSAARALQSAFSHQNSEQTPITVNTVQILEEGSVLTRQLANLYNWLLRHRQNWVKYYFQLLERLRPNESVRLFQHLRSYGEQLLATYPPDVIVSVHPMLQHFFADLLASQQREDIPLVTVVTDPADGFWRGWACPTVKQYFVATEAAQQQLVEYGIPPEKIMVAGMPVHPHFHPVSPQEKQQLRVKYGLHPQRFTLLVNAGWIGGGNIPKIYQALSQSENLEIQVVFLAGKNDKLAHHARQFAQTSHLPILVFDFVSSIHELMQLSDAMVSKLGGLTTFEALACELPLIADTITPPMPQEAATVQWLRAQDLAIFLKRPEEIVSAIALLANSSEKQQQLRQVSRLNLKPNSTAFIASRILQLSQTVNKTT
ncbi:MAG: glycosyltransferase [Halothece sp. Uz-M2-17]|nr:glycosyltransferase [Halothece sp. Uz-M2-17]